MKQKSLLSGRQVGCASWSLPEGQTGGGRWRSVEWFLVAQLTVGGSCSVRQCETHFQLLSHQTAGRAGTVEKPGVHKG